MRLQNKNIVDIVFLQPWNWNLKKLVKKKTLINIDKIINWTEIF